MGKRPHITLFLAFFACLYAIQLGAQGGSLRIKTIDASQTHHTLDTLTILPPLLQANDSVSGNAVPINLLKLHNNQISIDTSSLNKQFPTCSKITLSYRVLSVNLADPTFRIDTTARKRNNRLNDIAFDYSPYQSKQSTPFDKTGIQSNGSYTRGLSLGNNQNLTFNSNLNLQLQGKLDNNLLLRAALSDNSMPLQPDGSTQRLQEFDRVYIELEKHNFKLSAGDMDFNRPTDHFSNYFKRIQGAKFSSPPNKNAPGGWLGIGISRGKFQRQLIQGQEGNQGPYRLQGAEGERFIIVLSGTERIFIDGLLLKRGMADDYIIDYNLGEITFTTKQLITKDKRIIIEFEYAVQNFLRSTIAAQTEWKSQKSHIWFNYYSEQDGINSSGNLDLSPENRAQLAQAGDQLQNAFVSGIDTLPTFEPFRVLYQSIDTNLCSGQSTRILIYSTDPQKAKYTARFTEVPQGQGNYIQAQNSANGRVYQWVPPDPITCQPSGNFEPIIQLIAPEQKQLHTLGGSYTFSDKTTLKMEGALSKRDLNRFSPLNDNDNLGVGLFCQLQHQLIANENWQSIATAATEWISASFQPLNPYRNPEFQRDWNLSPQPNTGISEQLLKATWGITRKNWGELQFEINQFQREQEFQAQRWTLKSTIQNAGWELRSELNQTNSNSPLENTTFSRPKLDLSRAIKRKNQSPLLKIGLYAEREKNSRNQTNVDSLLPSSFWYDLLRIYTEFPNTGKNIQMNAYWSQRTDYTPIENNFLEISLARDINWNGSWKLGNYANSQKKYSSALEWNLTNRTLSIPNPQFTTLQEQKSYLGRIDYRITALKNGITLTTGYEIGSGQTPKLEFNYLLVNPGEGQYTWFDRNQDSILQVDEMELAVFKDQASYVRVAVSTPQYIRTNNTLLNQYLMIEPKWWLQSNPKGALLWLSKLAIQSNWQTNLRVRANNPNNAWKLLQHSIQDTALLNALTTMRHTLLLNRANPYWDASFSYHQNNNQSLITTGVEQKTLQEYVLHGRTRINRFWSIEADLLQNKRTSAAQLFLNRNFLIEGWELSPKINWLMGNQLRASAKYSFKHRNNQSELAEKAVQNDWNFSINWTPSPKNNKNNPITLATNLQAKFSYIQIGFNGLANTPIAFAMLDGLQDGQNLLWGLTIDRQISKTIQLNLNYEGRRTGNQQGIVHVGRMQLRALF